MNTKHSHFGEGLKHAVPAVLWAFPTTLAAINCLRGDTFSCIAAAVAMEETIRHSVVAIKENHDIISPQYQLSYTF